MDDYEDYSFLQGANNPAAAPGAVDVTGQGQMPYSAMAAPGVDMQELEMAPANPQEYGDRMTRWAKIAHRFQTDTNLQRALMMAGASLAQPVQPGQTPAGHVANAAVIGTNAFQMGQQADFQRQTAIKKEEREDKRVSQEGTRIGLEERRVAQGEAESVARLPGLRAESRTRTVAAEVAEMGLPHAMERIDLELRQLRTAAESASEKFSTDRVKWTTEAVESLLRRNDLSAEQRRKAELQQAQIGELTARAQKHGREGTTGTGSGATSAVVQQRQMWVDAFNERMKLDPNDPELKGMNAQQFADQKMSTGKEKDASEMLAKLLPHLEVEHPLIQKFMAQAMNKGAPRAGATADIVFVKDPKTGKLVMQQPQKALGPEPKAAAAPTTPPAPPAAAQRPAPPAPPAAAPTNTQDLKTMIIGPLTNFETVKAAAAAGNSKAIARLKEIEEAEANRAPNQPGM